MVEPGAEEEGGGGTKFEKRYMQRRRCRRYCRWMALNGGGSWETLKQAGNNRDIITLTFMIVTVIIILTAGEGEFRDDHRRCRVIAL